MFDVELIKATVAVGCTDQELALFLHTCRRLGLDPLAKQVYAIRRWSKALGREAMAIQIGIDGYRAVAERTGQLDGILVEWCADDGVWRDVWLGKGQPAAAKATIWRKGCSHPFVAVARFADYQQTSRDGRPTGLWGQQGPLMIGKVAEVLGLRRAFPADLSGTYGEGELPDDGPAPAVDQGKVMADRAAATSLPASSAPALPAATPAGQLDDLLIAVRECETEDALRRMAGELGKLGGPARGQARQEYARRLAEIRKGGAA